ncbi:MAG: polyphenol oxidase family protein [Syntrophobacteraceae bacterium]
MQAGNSNGKVPFLTFKNLSGVPGLVHGVFTRHGGVSRPPFESLNAAWSNGDAPEAVLENLGRIRRSLGLKKLVSSRQFHGDTITFIEGSDGLVSWREDHEQASLLVAPPGDALATDQAGMGLIIKIADCQSILLVDPKKRVIANVHSGWRGSVLNIGGKTVEDLKKRYGCDPSGMLAAVSPSLGPCCAEFVNYRDELPPELWDFRVRPDYFDFWAITRSQLTAAGIPGSNIEFAQRCTVCEKKDFFSHRGERAKGRMASVIGWSIDWKR